MPLMLMRSLRRYHLKDVVIGKIYFLLVRIKVKYMEIALIKRESTGSGTAPPLDLAAPRLLLIFLLLVRRSFICHDFVHNCLWFVLIRALSWIQSLYSSPSLSFFFFGPLSLVCMKI
jgi:hypothetical protein